MLIRYIATRVFVDKIQAILYAFVALYSFLGVVECECLTFMPVETVQRNCNFIVSVKADQFLWTFEMLIVHGSALRTLPLALSKCGGRDIAYGPSR